MNSTLKAVLLGGSMLVISTMTGCASNFVKPPQEAISLGKSSGADVIKIAGAPTYPEQISKVNGETVKALSYFYNDGAKFWGLIIPWRSMLYTTYNDVVVGEEFNSTMDGESTEFPVEKVSQIVKGKSTKDEVISILGNPSGKIIFPLVNRKDQTGLVYAYKYARFAGILTSPTEYIVVIVLDAQNIVDSISYKKNGIEQPIQLSRN